MWQDPEVWELQVGLWAFGANGLLWFWVFSVVLYVGYRGARAKGYQPTSAALIVLAGFATGILLTVLTGAIPSRTSGLFAIFFLVFWVPLLLSTAAIGVLLSFLPQRRTRVFGPRAVRFPFVGVGMTLLVAVLMFSISSAARWAGGNSDRTGTVAGLTITALLCPIALYLIRRGRRLETSMPVEEVLAGDGRPPVLYLRAFGQESQFFVIGAASVYGAHAKSLHASMSGAQFNVGLTFEEYLCDATSAGIGPFVALGSPEDYLPPEGRCVCTPTTRTGRSGLINGPERPRALSRK
jgi:hypothetical protein